MTSVPLESPVTETVSLRDFIERLLLEMDKRYQERFEAQKEAIRVAIFGDGFLLYKEHVSAIPPAGYTTPDIIMHIAILVLGVFLMDPKRTLELIGQVKDRIPLIGGGK